MNSERLKAILRSLDAEIDARAELAGTEPRDLYAWGAALAAIIDRLDAATSVVGAGVGRLASEPGLRDDMGVDPVERLAVAVEEVEQIRAGLADAGASARRFHSTIGHVGRRFEGG